MNETTSASPKEQLNPPAQPLGTGSIGNETAALSAGVQGSDRASMDSSDLDESAKAEFLWHTHQYLGDYARFADTKAAFVGTIAAALLGGIYAAKLHTPIIQQPYTSWPLYTWLAAVSGVFLILVIVLAIWTVVPRLGTTQSKGFIYWGSIASHGKVEVLQTSFHSQSARTLNDHLVHHVFDISSKVCIPKYRSVALCIWALVIGGFLATSALVLQPDTHNSATTTVLAPQSK